MIARLLFNKVSFVVFLLIAAWFIINSFAPDQVGISGISWSNASASVCSNGAQTFQCKGILTHRNTSNRAYHFPDVGGEVLLTEAEQFIYNKTFLDSTFEEPNINNASFSLATIRDLAEPLSVADGGFGVDSLAEFFTFTNQNVRIEARHIDSGAITSSKIRRNAVSTSGIKDGSLVAANVAPDVKIPPENIPANFGTTIKFVNGSVVSDKIGLLERANFNFSSVRNEHLIDGGVGESSFSSSSVTESKLASNSVTSDKILNGTILEGDFSNRIDLDVELPDYISMAYRSRGWAVGAEILVITEPFTANRMTVCAIDVSAGTSSGRNRWVHVNLSVNPNSGRTGARYNLPFGNGRYSSTQACMWLSINRALVVNDRIQLFTSCRTGTSSPTNSANAPVDYDRIVSRIDSGEDIGCSSGSFRAGPARYFTISLWREE